MATAVARDPFARGEYNRKTYTKRTWTSFAPFRCAWCGQGEDKQRLYTYTWQSDGGRNNWEDETLFCDLACYRIYYGS